RWRAWVERTSARSSRDGSGVRRRGERDGSGAGAVPAAVRLGDQRTQPPRFRYRVRRNDAGGVTASPHPGRTTHQELAMPARTARSTAPVAPPVPSLAVAELSPAAPALPTVQPSGYRGLKVWQRAMDLAAVTYHVAGAMPD